MKANMEVLAERMVKLRYKTIKSRFSIGPEWQAVYECKICAALGVRRTTMYSRQIVFHLANYHGCSNYFAQRHLREALMDMWSKKLEGLVRKYEAKMAKKKGDENV